MAICYEVERPVSSYSPERARVGDVIKRRRLELKISQEAMARRVGLSYAGYRPYEAGARDLGSEDLPVWAEALEMTRTELATRLGLGQAQIRTAYGAEVEELLEGIPDPEVVEEVMQAIRAVARAVAANRPQTDT